MLIVFDDMITDMKANKKLKQIVADLFMRGRKRNILLVFVSQYYFKVPNDTRLKVTQDFITKTPNKREIQQILLKDSSDIEFKDFMKLCKDYIKKTPFSVLVNDTTLTLNNPLTITSINQYMID